MLQAAAEKATAKRSAPQHCRKAGGQQSSTIGAVQVCLPPLYPKCASAEQVLLSVSIVADLDCNPYGQSQSALCLLAVMT